MTPIHTVNGSLFPDADPDSVTWTGPPLEIVTVQCLLYASLAISLFVAFLAMLGKQWVNRYPRNRRGSATDESRDRRQKLDGLQKWIYPAIESPPVMLQFGLLLLGCTLSLYLWTISRTVAGVILAFTIFGVTPYVFLNLAATLYYDCPYQTPPSILVRIAARRLKHGDTVVARSLVSDCIPPFLQGPQTNCQPPSFWSSRYFGEVPLHPNSRRGSRAHTARCYRRIRSPGSSDRLGGLQGRCSLHLLGARVHHRSRRNIVHHPVHSRCLGLMVDMCDPDIFQLRHPIHIPPRLQHIRNPTQGERKHAAEGSFGSRGQTLEGSASITMLDSLKPFWLRGQEHRVRADI